MRDSSINYLKGRGLFHVVITLLHPGMGKWTKDTNVKWLELVGGVQWKGKKNDIVFLGSASKLGSVLFFHLFWCNWDHNQFTKRGQVVVTGLDWAEPVIQSSVLMN
jgi:hypothetical protein